MKPHHTDFLALRRPRRTQIVRAALLYGPPLPPPCLGCGTPTEMGAYDTGRHPKPGYWCCNGTCPLYRGLFSDQVWRVRVLEPDGSQCDLGVVL